MVKANQIMAKGLEELSKEFVSLTKSSMETAAATTKAVFAAKTLKDVVELNKGYTKSSMEKFVADSTKLSEMSAKVASESFAPVTARMTVALEKVLKPAAA
jgi:phasin family protein